MKIGIVGVGTIGKSVIKNVISQYKDKLNAVFVYDLDIDNLKHVKADFEWLKPVKSLEEIVKKSDFLVESASVACVKSLIPLIEKYKKDVLFMSTGGLLSREDFLKKSEEQSVEIIIPHGAIAGLDAIKAVKLAGIKSLSITSYKPVRSLLGSPYLVKNKINLKNVKGKKLIFEGSVKEAVKGFPKSVNVSATLLLSSGFKDLKVRVYAHEDSKTIIHVVDVESNISNLQLVSKNYPSLDNPRTSALAIYSACEHVRQYIFKNFNKK
ncbi:MAG: DUF108 domain-containing protein [Candidatus Saelkia tenebricola]|nr:DUF108 domain-containing protein [Candidatus Saelkia tenebricola]